MLLIVVVCSLFSFFCFFSPRFSCGCCGGCSLCGVLSVLLSCLLLFEVASLVVVVSGCWWLVVLRCSLVLFVVDC